jgi:hypothetical protein
LLRDDTKIDPPARFFKTRINARKCRSVGMGGDHPPFLLGSLAATPRRRWMISARR